MHRGNLEESIKSNREEGTTVVELGREGERGVKRGKRRERIKLERRVFEADELCASGICPFFQLPIKI